MYIRIHIAIKMDIYIHVDIDIDTLHGSYSIYSNKD